MAMSTLRQFSSVLGRPFRQLPCHLSSTSLISHKFPLSSPFSIQKASFSAPAAVHPNFLSHDYLIALTEHLTRNKSIKQTQITEFLNLYKAHMSSDNFLTFLERVGKRRLLIPYHIYIIACGLKYVNNGNDLLNLNQFDTLFTSLSYMCGRVGGVRCLVFVTAEKFAENNELISSNRMGNYLTSLRDMKSGHSEIRKLCQVFEKKIQSSMSEPLQTSDFANGFQSMHQLSSRYSEICSLLSALNTALVTSSDSRAFFTPNESARVLMGFRRLSPEVKEVQAILQTILSKIDLNSLQGLTSKELSMAYCVTTSLCITHTPETRRILAILKAMSEGSKERLSSSMNETILEKLKDLQRYEGNDVNELRDLIAVLERE